VRLRRPVKLAAGGLAAAGLGVSAASAVVGAPAAPTPQSAVPVAGTERIGPIAPDPVGGLGWALRVYMSTSGGSCVEVGRARAGRFGHVDAAGTFRALPLDEVGTCGDLAAEPVILAVNTYAARADRAARTVLFGRAGPAVVDVVVQRRDGSVQARPTIGAAGGFLLPLVGTVAPTELPVTITLEDGRRRVYGWG
jgi:hypothetical protein